MRSSDIIGIFDIENTSVSKLTKEYLRAGKWHRVTAFPEPPKLYCVPGKGWDYGVYFTILFPPCANEAALSTGWD